MLYPFRVWALGIETLWKLAYKEFIAPKYTESVALKHLKVFI